MNSFDAANTTEGGLRMAALGSEVIEFLETVLSRQGVNIL